MLDADLAILGANPIQYQAYAAAIRQEYAWVSDADYRVGRCRVLQAFLSQSQIYFTASVLEELDATARSNLKAEIRLLNNSFSQRS
jgi:predicted metal-dependent HD superfamily phosphohydrolase